MVDLSQDSCLSPEVRSLETPGPAERRVRTWYNLYLLVYLIGPALVAIAIMGWLKTG